MSDDFMDQPVKAGEYEAIHRRMSKPPQKPKKPRARTSRAEAIAKLESYASLDALETFTDPEFVAALRKAIRALKAQQKAEKMRKLAARLRGRVTR